MYFLIQEDRTWSHYSNITENFSLCFHTNPSPEIRIQVKPDASRLGNFHHLQYLIRLCFLPFQINILALIPFYTSGFFKQINIFACKKKTERLSRDLFS